ncbi:MAG: ATP-binding protein [Bacteroidales bacterium]|nr:ATP-binding protein [Bacteroidales bacterium]
MGIELRSSLSELAKTDEFMQQIMSDYQIDTDYFGILSFLLHECAKNAIVHGNQFNAEKKTYIECHINKQSLEFSVRDEGKGFDYQSILNSPVDGRGLAAVRLLADKLEFSHQGSMVKYSISIPFSFPKKHLKAADLMQNRLNKINQSPKI